MLVTQSCNLDVWYFLFQLGHLLKTVVNCTDDVSPEASLFIANKWENVPDKDKKDVQTDIFEKLSKVYPGIKPKQVHYMSVSKVGVRLTMS